MKPVLKSVPCPKCESTRTWRPGRWWLWSGLGLVVIALGLWVFILISPMPALLAAAGLLLATYGFVEVRRRDRIVCRSCGFRGSPRTEAAAA